MGSLDLVLAGTVAIVATGVAALLLVRTPALATSVAAWGASLGGAAGLWAATLALGGAWTAELVADWRVPGGELIVGVDPLSALFLAPLFALGVHVYILYIVATAISGLGWVAARDWFSQ